MMFNNKIITLCLLGASAASAENSLRNTKLESAMAKTLTGLSYKFERMGQQEGKGQTCVDSEKKSFDYGERHLNKNDVADDCAHFCVHEQDAKTLGHLVGFNFHFEDSLCQCLYKDSKGVASAFDTFVESNNGEEKVEGTEEKAGWQCFAGAGVSVTGVSVTTSGIPFRDQAEENDSSNDMEEEKKVGNEIFDTMVAVKVEVEQSSNDSSLCSSNSDCPPERERCVRRNCQGVGTCQSRGAICPDDVKAE